MIDNLKIIKLLIDVFCLNPFWRILDGSSALHVAVKEGRDSIVRFFLAQTYVLRNDKKMEKIKISKMVNKADKEEYNTPLHLAILKGREALVNDLIRAGAKIFKTNFLEWNPFEMSKARNFYKMNRKFVKLEERKELIEEAKFFEPEVIPKKLFGNIFKFKFMINSF